MATAHSKDNGSPTSVAHNLDDSVVVRRDDLVVIDNAALGTLCEDVQIASRRNAGILEVEWFRNGSELTLFQTFANRAAAAAQHEETWTGQGFSGRVARSCRHVRTVLYGRGCVVDDMLATPLGAGIETYAPLGAPFRRPRACPAPERYRMRYDMELVTGDLDAVKAFLRERQNLARADPGILDFEFYFSAPRSVTLLACYADAAAQQRSFIRWMKAEEMKSVLAVKDIYTYGRVALEPGTSPRPPGWMELMLVTHHQEPVGRCFQR